MDRIEAFYNAHIAPAQESIAAAALATIGIISVLSVPAAIIKSHRNKQEMVRVQQEKEQAKKSHEAWIAKLREDLKKVYGLDASAIPDGKITSMDQMKLVLFSEMKKALAAIRRSVSYKAYITNIINTNELELRDAGYKPSDLDHSMTIREGVSGWEETLETCTGEQDVRIAMGHVTNDLAYFLETRFENYISSVGTGDGDEGHIYYTIKSFEK